MRYTLRQQPNVNEFMWYYFSKADTPYYEQPQANFADALIYMRIVCGATIVVAGYNMISSVLRALGDSKTPLIFLIIASGINMY
ncbi:hypothetical protein C823_008047 [Eubacterium plexicaudatum ASF492]|nr:hypothetical protein C823_008047 [Eubacterium plexicaudatum ASF492]